MFFCGHCCHEVQKSWQYIAELLDRCFGCKPDSGVIDRGLEDFFIFSGPFATTVSATTDSKG
jgi:hypothetical protein